MDSMSTLANSGLGEGNYNPEFELDDGTTKQMTRDEYYMNYVE